MKVKEAIIRLKTQKNLLEKEWMDQPASSFIIVKVYNQEMPQD